MRSWTLAALLLSFGSATACGQVVIDGGGNTGGGGDGGATSGGAAAAGGGGPCSDVTCSGDAISCSCVTTCPGKKLKADCAYKEDQTLVCECHLDGGYLGICGQSGGSACALPGGCCEAYL